MNKIWEDIQNSCQGLCLKYPFLQWNFLYSKRQTNSMEGWKIYFLYHHGGHLQSVFFFSFHCTPPLNEGSQLLLEGVSKLAKNIIPLVSLRETFVRIGTAVLLCPD